ncbi:MAG TPA: 16S rRNA (guanine(527)-N(7))-methyltransferase RsmG, partial [Solirubrobacteraceae bacterium]|nr:16S rRNA (guanine(527)-N(7))-methyltransferase RsmG [Solirubrobacteraceae bacterium]
LHRVDPRAGAVSDRRHASAERLADVARAHELPTGAEDRLARLLALLAGDRSAPTTVRAPERAVDIHVADSLSALELDVVRQATQVADLGAGAGFPGLALAAALPATKVSLVESVGRKCAFIERAIATAGIANATAVCGRAEEWRDGTGRHDLVTARALAPLNVIAEYAAPLLALGGALVAWKGARNAGEEADAAAAAAVLGLEAREVRRVEPFPAAEHRNLHVYLKVTETPPRFPRRPGMARKRPLRPST